ncbi:hypothetical protein ACRRTK_017284 [Alexandromys fortis]
MQDVSGTGETLLHLRPASVTGYIGDLKPQEDTEFMGPAVEEPTLPEAGPVHFLPLEQPLPKSADTQSPIDVAANVPTARQTLANERTFPYSTAFPTECVSLHKVMRFIHTEVFIFRHAQFKQIQFCKCVKECARSGSVPSMGNSCEESHSISEKEDK